MHRISVCTKIQKCSCLLYLLITALSSDSRKTRGRALPSCGSGVTEPTSTKPNPSFSIPSTASPCLSKPAAKPIGLPKFRFQRRHFWQTKTQISYLDLCHCSNFVNTHLVTKMCHSYRMNSYAEILHGKFMFYKEGNSNSKRVAKSSAQSSRETDDNSDRKIMFKLRGSSKDQSFAMSH